MTKSKQNQSNTPINEQPDQILLDQHQALLAYLKKQLTTFQHNKLYKLLDLERELTLRENQ